MSLGDSAGTFRIMDISIPSAPVELGSIDYPSSIYDLAISADQQTAYLGLYGMQIVDISTPSAPTHLGEFSLSEYFFVSSLAVTDAGVYCIGDDGIYLVDVTTPDTPVELGLFDTSQYMVQLVAGAATVDHCYVAMGAGALALDFSIPATPSDAASIHTGYYVRGIAVQESVAKTSELVSEVYASTQEQSAGAAQILKTATHMQDTTREVASAAKQQATGAIDVSKAVAGMTQMTQQVADATLEQKKGGDQVVKAVEQIAAVARQNSASTDQLAATTQRLANEAERLQGLANRFTV